MVRLTESQPGAHRQQCPHDYAEKNTYKFAKTPTLVCLPVSMAKNRSGFHVCALSPQTSGSLMRAGTQRQDRPRSEHTVSAYR